MPKHFTQKIISIFLSFLFVFSPFSSLITPIQFAEAAFLQDDSEGTFEVDFNGGSFEGTDSSFVADGGTRIGVNANAGGFIEYDTGIGGAEQEIQTVDITPTSFDAWKYVDIDVLTGSVDAEVISCTSANLLPRQTVPANGIIDISAIPVTEDCLRLVLYLPTGSPRPSIDNAVVVWDPLPVYLIQANASRRKDVGGVIAYVLSYSVSFASSAKTYIFAPLPSATNATGAYGQDTTTSFIGASKNGTLCETLAGCDVEGDGSLIIPVDNVYYDLGTVPSGTTGVVSFTAKTKNGLEDGLIYEGTASIAQAGGPAVQVDSGTVSTTLSSEPAPSIAKSSSAITVSSSEFVSPGSLDITYTVATSNNSPYSGTGHEELFNPVIVDDLSDIMEEFVAVCGVADEATAQGTITINDGGIFNAADNTITWDSSVLDNLEPGATDSVSYIVAYPAGCPVDPTGTVYLNTASLTADNMGILTDTLSVQFGVDDTPTGTFAKGDRVGGAASATASTNDNSGTTQDFGEVFSYILKASNDGAVAIGDSVMYDRLPEETTFLSAATPYGTMYYHDSTSATVPDFNITADDGTSTVGEITDGVAPVPAGSGWQTDPNALGGDVVWVMTYIPCLSSSSFRTPAYAGICSYNGGVTAGPYQFQAEVQVQIKDPADPTFPGAPLANPACYVGDFTNTMTSEIHAAGGIDLLLGTPTALAPVVAVAVDDIETTSISYPTATFDTDNSSLVGPDTTLIGEKASYNISLKNTGDEPANGTSVRVEFPTLNIDGDPTGMLTLDSVSASYTIDPAPTPTYVDVTLPSIASQATRDFTITFNVPSGALDGETFTVNAVVSHTHPDACSTTTTTLQKTTTLEGVPELSIEKTRDEAVIITQGDVHYDITFLNSGDVPTTGTYIIDAIPSNMRFGSAYTFGTDATNTEFGKGVASGKTCTGCEVYVSTNSADLPVSPDPAQVLSASSISNYFTLADHNGTGEWTAPAGIDANDITWVAFKVDDTSLTPPQFPTGSLSQSFGTVGLTLTNDEDGRGAGSAGSPTGEIIANAAAVFTDLLLQSIAPAVFTTVSTNPGVALSKIGVGNVADTDAQTGPGFLDPREDAIIYDGENFYWYIEFYNNTNVPLSTLSLIDTLPEGMNLNGVYLDWNLYENPPAGQTGRTGNLSGAAETTVTAEANGTTTVSLDLIQHLGTDLDPLDGGMLILDVTPDTGEATGFTYKNKLCGQYEGDVLGTTLSGTACTDDTVTILNPDLGISKTALTFDPLPGETVTYSLSVENAGQNDALNVLITETLPAELCNVQNLTVNTSPWTLANVNIPTAGCGETFQFTLDHPSYDTGFIPEDSGIINITYEVDVDLGVAQGSAVTNVVTIANDITENPNNEPNTDSVTVTTSAPDPEVAKSAVSSVLPGSVFTYRVDYLNAERTASPNTYIIDTLPDFRDAADGSDVLISNAVDSRGNTVYYHGDNGGITPAFTIPGGGVGWSTTPQPDLAYVAIDFDQEGTAHTLDASANGTLTLTAQASDPDDNGTGLVQLPTPQSFTNTVTIAGDGDADLFNNTASAITATPGFDLILTKTANKEGGFPGTSPNDTLVYTITIENDGTEVACGIYIDDVLPTNVTLLAPIENFSTSPLALVDSSGNPVDPIIPGAAPFTVNDVPVGFDQTTMRWVIGDTVGNFNSTNHQDTCMPAGSQTSFSVFVEVNSDAQDGDIVTNTATVDSLLNTDADPLNDEEVTSNNTDDSSVFVFRSDVYAKKSGLSSDNDGDTADDTKDTEAGDTITYTIEYGNIGNASAEDVVINEVIPAGSCYVVGSAQDVPDTTIEYSNDGGITYDYTPLQDTDGKDCNVTHFRYIFNVDLPAGDYLGQSCAERTDVLRFDGVDDSVILNDTYLRGGEPVNIDFTANFDNINSNRAVFSAGGYTTLVRGLGLRSFGQTIQVTTSDDSSYAAVSFPANLIFPGEDKTYQFRWDGTASPAYLTVDGVEYESLGNLIPFESLSERQIEFGSVNAGSGDRLDGTLKNISLEGYFDIVFDEGQGSVAQDSSGNGNHGEIIGATWESEDCGFDDSFDTGLVAVGTANTEITYEAVPVVPFGYSQDFCPMVSTDSRLFFDATPANYVRVDSVTYTDTETYSLWFQNPGSIPVSERIMQTENSDRNLLIQTGTQTLFGRVDETPDPGGNWTQYTPRALATSYSPRTRTHAVLALSPTTRDLYVNGVLMDSKPNFGSLNVGTEDFLIGYGFEGEVSDFARFDRYLNAAEVVDIYTNGVDVLDPDLDFLFPLDESIGDPLVDASGNGTTASVIGSPWKYTCPYIAAPSVDDAGRITLVRDDLIISEQKISDTQGGLVALLDNSDFFGYSTASLGDLDGDGIGDILVGARDDDDDISKAGAAYILFLNEDGTVKSEVKITEVSGVGFTGDINLSDRFGAAAANIGDLNDDGVTDIAIVAQGDDDGNYNAGAVYILFMNTDGTVASWQKISNDFGGLAATGITLEASATLTSVAGLGDFDGDGVEDIVIGSTLYDGLGTDRGAVYILLLNADGTVKAAQEISELAGGFQGELDDVDYFGDSVESLGDLDGDGIGDIAVGATRDNDGNTDRGAVYLLFLNADGTVKNQQKISGEEGNFNLLDGFTTQQRFGRSLEYLGDYDNDGNPELAVGMIFRSNPSIRAGSVFVLDLDNNGTVLEAVEVPEADQGFVGPLGASDFFGSSIAYSDIGGVQTLSVGATRDNDGGTSRGAMYNLTIDPNRYVSSGTLTTPVVPNTTSLQGWKNLLVKEDLPAGTSITYDIGRWNTGTLTCDTAATEFTTLQGLTAVNSAVDISGVPATETAICVVSNLATSDTSVTPSLESILVTYQDSDPSTFTFEVLVTDSEIFDPEIPNAINISTSTAEIDDTNNDDTASLFVAIADLAIEKTVDRSAITTTEIDAGDTLSYTLDYENFGPTPAENTVIIDTLPEAQNIASVTYDFTGSTHFTTCGRYDNDANTGDETVICSLDGGLTYNGPDIPAGASGSVVLTVTYTPGAFVSPADDGAILSNQVEITSDTAEITKTNNTDSVPTVLDSLANVYIKKETTQTFINIDSDIVYTFEYGNNGNTDALNVVITDDMNPETGDLAELDYPATLVDFTGSTHFTGGDCTIVASDLICSTASIPAGESGVLSVTMSVLNDTSLLTNATDANNQILENSILIETTTSEVTLSDNTDSVTTPIVSAGLSNITGYVFYDKSEDGLFDGTEEPIANTTLILAGTDSYGGITAPPKNDPSRGTDSDGDGVPDATEATDGTDPNLNTSFIDSDGDGVSDYMEDLVGTDKNNAGDTPADADTDGIPDSIENSAIEVFYNEAYDTAMAALGLPGNTHENPLPANYYETAIGVTDSQGFYGFAGLRIGTYTVVQTQPTGYITTINTPGTGSATDGTLATVSGQEAIDDIILAENETSAGNNFGEDLGSIGDTVFVDDEGNGIDDTATDYNGTYDVGTDTLLESVVVTLYEDENNNNIAEATELIAQATTDVNGAYLFDDLLLDRDYIVVVTDDTNIISTANYGNFQGTGLLNNISKDAAGYEITLSAGNKDDDTADFGYVHGYIGNLVFDDRNADLDYDAGTDALIQGVEITIYLDDGDGLKELGADDIQADATPGTVTVDPIFTDVNGEYVITGLNPTRSYWVVVTDGTTSATTPVVGATYQSLGTVALAGTDGVAKDETGYLAVLATTSAATVTNQLADFGYLRLDGVLGDTVYEDINANGQYDTGVDVPIDGVTVDIVRVADGITIDRQTTGVSVLDYCPAGSGNCPGVIPFGPLAGSYWSETDATNITFEAGGVVIDPSSNTYRFVVSDTGNILPATDYLHIPSTTVGATTDNQSKDPTGYDVTLQLTDAERANMTGDFGYLRLNGLVEGTIFEDTDVDGTYTFGTDNPIDNITVNLYQDANSNGTYETGTDTFITSQVTGTVATESTAAIEAGTYSFQKLDPRNTYFVTVDVNDADFVTHFLGSTTYAHFAGTNPGADNNSQTGDTTGYALALTATPNILDRQNLTGDFGYIGSGQVGNLAYFDSNLNGVYDAGTDTPLNNVDVTLYQDDGDGIMQLGAADTLVGTQTTGALGTYLFTGLDAGAQHWATVTAPNGLYLHAGPLGLATTDNTSKEQTGFLTTFTAANGFQDLTADFGFTFAIGEIEGTIFVDEDESGAFAVGDVGLENVEVTLYQDDGDGIQETGVGGDDLAIFTSTTLTDINGDYSFASLDPNADFWIVVTDSSTGATTVITDGGYEHVAGATGSVADNISKAPTGYGVNLAATLNAYTNVTADFGYAIPQEESSSRGGSRRRTETISSYIPEVTPVPIIPSGTSNGLPPVFETSFDHCYCGYDIYLLQVLLNHNGYPVATAGAGSRGQETDCYGFKTYKAIKLFQADWHLPVSGYFTVATKNTLNTLIDNGYLTFPEGLEVDRLDATEIVPYTGPFFDPLMAEGGAPWAHQDLFDEVYREARNGGVPIEESFPNEAGRANANTPSAIPTTITSLIQEGGVVDQVLGQANKNSEDMNRALEDLGASFQEEPEEERSEPRNTHKREKRGFWAKVIDWIVFWD